MPRRKITLSLDQQLVEKLRLVAAITKREQSGIVSEALEDYFQILSDSAGKDVSELVEEASSFKEAMEERKHSELPTGEGPVTSSRLPGDRDVVLRAVLEDRKNKQESEGE